MSAWERFNPFKLFSNDNRKESGKVPKVEAKQLSRMEQSALRTLIDFCAQEVPAISNQMAASRATLLDEDVKQEQWRAIADKAYAIGYAFADHPNLRNYLKSHWETFAGKMDARSLPKDERDKFDEIQRVVAGQKFPTEDKAWGFISAHASAINGELNTHPLLYAALTNPDTGWKTWNLVGREPERVEVKETDFEDLPVADQLLFTELSELMDAISEKADAAERKKKHSAIARAGMDSVAKTTTAKIREYLAAHQPDIAEETWTFVDQYIRKGPTAQDAEIQAAPADMRSGLLKMRTTLYALNDYHLWLNGIEIDGPYMAPQARNSFAEGQKLRTPDQEALNYIERILREYAENTGRAKAAILDALEAGDIALTENIKRTILSWAEDKKKEEAPTMAGLFETAISAIQTHEGGAVGRPEPAAAAGGMDDEDLIEPATDDDVVAARTVGTPPPAPRPLSRTVPAYPPPAPEAPRATAPAEPDDSLDAKFDQSKDGAVPSVVKPGLPRLDDVFDEQEASLRTPPINPPGTDSLARIPASEVPRDANPLPGITLPRPDEAGDSDWSDVGRDSDAAVSRKAIEALDRALIQPDISTDRLLSRTREEQKKRAAASKEAVERKQHIEKIVAEAVAEKGPKKLRAHQADDEEFEYRGEPHGFNLPPQTPETSGAEHLAGDNALFVGGQRVGTFDSAKQEIVGARNERVSLAIDDMPTPAAVESGPSGFKVAYTPDYSFSAFAFVQEKPKARKGEKKRLADLKPQQTTTVEFVVDGKKESKTLPSDSSVEKELKHFIQEVKENMSERQRHADAITGLIREFQAAQNDTGAANDWRSKYRDLLEPTPEKDGVKVKPGKDNPLRRKGTALARSSDEVNVALQTSLGADFPAFLELLSGPSKPSLRERALAKMAGFKDGVNVVSGGNGTKGEPPAHEKEGPRIKGLLRAHEEGDYDYVLPEPGKPKAEPPAPAEPLRRGSKYQAELPSSGKVYEVGGEQDQLYADVGAVIDKFHELSPDMLAANREVFIEWILKEAPFKATVEAIEANPNLKSIVLAKLKEIGSTWKDLTLALPTTKDAERAAQENMKPEERQLIKKLEKADEYNRLSIIWKELPKLSEPARDYIHDHRWDVFTIDQSSYTLGEKVYYWANRPAPKAYKDAYTYTVIGKLEGKPPGLILREDETGKKVAVASPEAMRNVFRVGKEPMQLPIERKDIGIDTNAVLESMEENKRNERYIDAIIDKFYEMSPDMLEDQRQPFIEWMKEKSPLILTKEVIAGDPNIKSYLEKKLAAIGSSLKNLELALPAEPKKKPTWKKPLYRPPEERVSP